MPVDIIEVEEWTSPIQAPADSDPANRRWLVEEPDSIAQALANRTNYLASVRGFIAHGGFWRESTTEVGWGALVFGSAGELVTLAAGTADFGSPTPNTWYYFYCFNNAGTAQIERSITAPDPTTGYRTKTGEPSKLYVGCCSSNSAGEYHPFRMIRGRYVYQRSAQSSVWVGNVQPLITTTSGATWTTQSFANVIPPHVRQAIFRATLIWQDPVATHVGIIKLRTPGDVASSTFAAVVRETGANVQADESIEFVTNGSRQVEYQLLTYAGDTVTSTGQLELIGFQE